MRVALTTVVLVAIGVILVMMVAEMPEFGAGKPASNEVSAHYVKNAVKETGASNFIAAIILDYRAYDTLGEVIVLFAGIAAVLVVLDVHNGGRGR